MVIISDPDIYIKIFKIQKKENQINKYICDIYIKSLDICSFEINNNIDFNNILDKEINDEYNFDIINLLNILYQLHFYL